MIKRTKEIVSAWRRRSVGDALAIFGICLGTYFAAKQLEFVEQLHEFEKKYADFAADNLIVVAVVFGFLMLIYSLRRGRDLNQEIIKRRDAEKKGDEHALQLALAVNNIPQGVLLFDAEEVLIACNNSYLEMYGLSADVVKPGATLYQIIQYRFSLGQLHGNADAYHRELLGKRSSRQVVGWKVTTSAGREISITNIPMANGGWVSMHEDRTEARGREESFRLLFDNSPMAMCVFDCETLRFLAANDAAVAQYGYSRQQFLSMRVPDIRGGDKASSEAFLRGLPETHNNVRQHVRADGALIQVSIQSRVLNYENRPARLVTLQDVTARKNAEDDLRRTKKFLDAVIENVPEPLVVKTVKDGCFVLVNKASEELHGYSRGETLGRTLYDIFPKDRADLITTQDAECVRANHSIVIGDHKLSTPRGERLVMSRKVIIHDDDDKPEYLLTLMDDVTERRAVEQRIAHMAHSDPLTDLPNRAAFNERLSATLKIAETEQRRFAVLCVDLDGFKGVNDIYGHAVGDLLLCQVADRLRSVTEGIFIARLGGDEFTLIAADAEKTSIAQLTDRLLAAFVDDFEIDGHRLPQALSIGVALYPADGTDDKTLLSNADAALYRAKADESGSVRFFEPEMTVRSRARAALQADLKAALQDDELSLHYQPQLKMTGEVTAFEALARWNSPKRGMVSPSEFIPLAEESSQILALGEWVLRAACSEAAAWNKPLNIAVNVSPVQFRHGDLPRLVHSILLETGLPPSRLELEVTEGVLIGDFSRALSILRRLKSLGVKIALDDFGKGYSSLSYLRAFPFDKIKIDRSFISDLESNHQSIAIVHAVIGLGRSLKIPILAEGVETQGQHAFLVQEGCDEVQGYLTGRPLAIADYAGLVGRDAIAVKLAHTS